MIVVAVIGWILILAALAVAAWEAIAWFEAGIWRPMPLGEVWFRLAPESLNVSQAVIQRYVSPWLWDPAIQTVLTWTGWAVLGGLGILLVLLARLARPRRSGRSRLRR